MRLFLIAFAAALHLFGQVSNAATYTIVPGSDGGAASIDAALAVVAEGDSVVFAPGRYYAFRYTDVPGSDLLRVLLPVTVANLTVLGPGDGSAIVSGSGSGTGTSGVYAGATPGLHVEGLVFEGVTYAVVSRGSTTIKGCSFEGSRAIAIAAMLESPLDSFVIEACSFVSGGVGVYVGSSLESDLGSVRIEDSTLAGANTRIELNRVRGTLSNLTMAGVDGALTVSESDLIVSGLDVTDARDYALKFRAGGVSQVRDSTFRDSDVHLVFEDADDVTLTRCEFREALNEHVRIETNSTASLSIRESTFDLSGTAAVRVLPTESSSPRAFDFSLNAWGTPDIGAIEGRIVDAVDDPALAVTIDFLPLATPTDSPATSRLALSLTAVPNPFNPITRIEFVGIERKHTTIQVFDVRGRHVADLFDGVATGVPQSITWRADDLPSGIYFVRATAGGEAVVQKVGLVR